MKSILRTFTASLITLALAGCSSSTNSGTTASSSGASGDAPATNCVSRCESLASKCSEDASRCGQICSNTTESQLACIESVGCDKAKQSTCLKSTPSGSGSGGSSSGGTSSGGSSSGSSSLKQEGDKCDCGGAIYCQSASGPCEASLSCLGTTCVDQEKKCKSYADCASGYTCTKMISQNVDLGTYCVKQK